MRRLLAVAIVSAAFLAGAPSALADQGAPGTTFPEQPGNNTATSCAKLITNPMQGVANASGTATGITIPLYVDDCFGG
jgi:hypothetical protein